MQTAILKGIITDEKKEPLPSAVVQVSQNGVIKGGEITDYDGNFTIRPLTPGYYDVTISYYGYDSVAVHSVYIGSGDTATVINRQMKPDKNKLDRSRHIFAGLVEPSIRPLPQEIKQ